MNEVKNLPFILNEVKGLNQRVHRILWFLASHMFRLNITIQRQMNKKSDSKWLSLATIPIPGQPPGAFENRLHR